MFQLKQTKMTSYGASISRVVENLTIHTVTDEREECEDEAATKELVQKLHKQKSI